MKQTLLLTLFLLCGLAAFSQDRFTTNSYNARTNTAALDVKIFPNPATDYIGLKNGEPVRQVRIYNMVGRQMKSFEEVQPGEKYYIGDLPRGMYLVQLIDDAKRVISTLRVNKQ